MGPKAAPGRVRRSEHPAWRATDGRGGHEGCHEGISIPDQLGRLKAVGTTAGMPVALKGENNADSAFDKYRRGEWCPGVKLVRNSAVCLFPWEGQADLAEHTARRSLLVTLPGRWRGFGGKSESSSVLVEACHLSPGPGMLTAHFPRLRAVAMTNGPGPCGSGLCGGFAPGQESAVGSCRLKGGGEGGGVRCGASASKVALKPVAEMLDSP